jgi:hypothetical protein
MQALERTADKDPYKAELLIQRAIGFLHMSKYRVRLCKLHWAVCVPPPHSLVLCAVVTAGCEQEALEHAIRAIEVVEKFEKEAVGSGKPSGIDWDTAHYYYTRAVAYRMSGDVLRAARDIERAMKAVGRDYAHRYVCVGCLLLVLFVCLSRVVVVVLVLVHRRRTSFTKPLRFS